ARTLAGDERVAAVEAAAAYLVEALVVHHDVGDHRNESDSLRVLAIVRCDQHRLPEARDLAERAVRRAEQSGDLRYTASARSTLASILLRLSHGADAEADRLHAAALTVA